MRKIRFFIFCLIIIFGLGFYWSHIKNKENVSLSQLEAQITNELGELDAKKLITELQNLSEVSKENINEICAEYGIALSDIQIKTIINNFNEWGNNSGFYDTGKEYLGRFGGYLKELWENSSFEVSQPEENQPIIKKDGDKITITIPKTEDVDKMVDGVIDAVKDYFIPNTETKTTE